MRLLEADLEDMDDAELSDELANDDLVDEILMPEDAEDDRLELLFELPKLLEIELEDTDDAELCEELANKLDEEKLTTELDVIMPKLLVEERLEDATEEI